MKTYLLTLIFGVLYVSSFAQNFSISGRVLDEDETALVGANIYFSELGLGTISDVDGYFTIKKIPAGNYKILVSFLGYENHIEIINTENLKETYTIKLKPNVLRSQEVVISSGTYSTQHENAIKIESLNTKKITNIGNPNIYQAISQVPGVDFISKSDGVSTPVIRGLSTSNILVLTNGIRMENYQFSEDHPYLIDEFGISTIEVLKGPASLLFGSDAIGGVLNFIEEKPAYKKNLSVDFNSFYNSNSNGFTNNLGLKGKLNDWFWNVRLGQKSHKDYTDGDREQVINSRYNSKNIKLSTGLNLSYGKFAVYYSYNKMQLGLTVPPSIKLVQDDDRNLNRWYQDLDNHLVYTKNTLFFNKLRTEINASYQINNRKLNIDPNQVPFNHVNMSLQTISYELKNNYRFGLGDLIFALQGKHQNNFNHDAPEIIVSNYSTDNFAALLLLQLSLNEKTHLQVGTRYDYIQIDIPQLIDSDQALNRVYNNISYSAGLTYQFTHTLLLRGNFASAFRTPNAMELSQDGIHGATYEKGNPNLKSQQNYEGDLSMHFHNQFLIIDASAFYNSINNYIFLSPSNDTVSNGLDVYQYMQNNASIYGSEWSAKIIFLKNFSLKESYSNIVAKQENGEYLPLIPQNKIKSTLRYQSLKWKKIKNISFALEHTYAFQQKNISTFENITPEYSIFNFNISIQKQLKSVILDFNLKLNNLLDVAYYDHLSTIKDLGYYNMGRNINLGFRVQF